MRKVLFDPHRRLLGLAGAVLASLLALGGFSGVAARSRVEPLDITTARGRFLFHVEIADTDAGREKGLMFRKSLAPDRGMLFDFKTPRPVAFWMKNTLIPLDMLFIDTQGRVLSIARDAKPMSETPIPSGGEVLGVLEVAGGRAAEIGAEPGDRVDERLFRH
ncbi:MAG: DUF192 domain-containing protein [Caulobacteraceae bacterium]